MIRLLRLLSIALLLSGCGTLTGPQPDPNLVAEIDSYFAKAKNETYQATGPFTRPVPYAVGQFVVNGMTGPDGRSVSRTAIVGQEQGGWVLESYALTPTSKSISQMLIVGLDQVGQTGSLDDVDVVWVKVKNNDEPVQKIDGAMLSMVKSFMKSSISDLVVRTQASTAQGGTVQTPAGTFQGTTKTRAESSFMGKTYTSDAWMHPAVPVNGMVKSIAIEDGQTIELLDFGLSGAKKSF